MMILGSVAAIAADGDLEKDDTVKITGLAEGDKVDFYQVLKWVDGAGWQLAPGFESLSSNTSIAKLINAANQEQVELSKSDVEAITNAAKTAIANTVSFDGAEKTSYTWSNKGPSISEVTPYDSSSEIQNVKGVELPSTGGIGTTIFYVGGSLLVLAAAILLITKRRICRCSSLFLN